MKPPGFFAMVAALAAATAAPAQPPPGGGPPPMTSIAAPDQSSALPLRPGAGVPARAENWVRIMDDIVVRNVTVPTITPFLPAPGTATGAAVVVAPGGGFRVLSMTNEGVAVAQWLADHGIAAFLVKYRLMPTPADNDAFAREMAQTMASVATAAPDSAPPPAYAPAVEDGVAAMRFVREHAAQYGVDPARVGMVGFSAGAMNTLATTLANQPGARPNFIGLIYGPMAPVTVPADAPPLFAALAADDPLFGRGGFGIIDSWRRAGRPVELHLYQKGGHGFGVRRNGTTTELWTEEFLSWIRTNGFLGQPVALAQPHSARPMPAAGMPPPPTPEFFRHLREIEARYHAMPDTPGSGRYPAFKEETASLPDHVVYRPRDLSRVPRRGLGILVWGNGGCAADGAGQRLHLAEIASHGYLVVANGRIASGPGFAEPPLPPPPVPGGPPNIPPPATSARQLVEAIDWAVGENSRAGSPLRGKIDTGAVAVSGWSCGGLQALQVAASDPRVRTTIIHNSGIFNGNSPNPAMDIDKATLDRLRAPILYVLGGPSDIAYANGLDDFHRITGVPAALAVLGDVGHGGSFYEPNGGAAASIAIRWLDWQLKHDRAAERWFVGPDCRLCTDPAWTYDSRNLPGRAE